MKAKLVLLQSSHQAKARSSSVGVSIIFILVLITAFDLGQFFAATLFLVIAFTLAMLSIQTTLLTPVQLVIFAYVLGFPMAVLLPDYFQSVSKYSPPPLALEKGMLWSLRGFAMFALGYVLVDQRKGVNKFPTRERISNFLRSRKASAVYVTKWAGLLATVGFVDAGGFAIADNGAFDRIYHSRDRGTPQPEYQQRRSRTQNQPSPSPSQPCFDS